MGIGTVEVENLAKLYEDGHHYGNCLDIYRCVHTPTRLHVFAGLISTYICNSGKIGGIKQLHSNWQNVDNWRITDTYID